MIHLKRFLVGLALPSVVLPFLLLSVYMANKPAFLGIPFLYFIPMIWGIWNILDHAIFKEISSKDKLLHALIVGAVLGFLVTSIGVYCFDASRLLGLSHTLTYLPLLIGPLFYALLWAFVVRPLNDFLID